MKKGKAPTRTKAEAEAAAKRAATRARNAEKKIESERKGFQARMRSLRERATGNGAKRLAMGAAGGAIGGAVAGAVAAFSKRYTGSPGLAGTIAKHTSDQRVAGAVTAGLGAAVALLTDGKKGKGAAIAGELGAAVAAGGAALAAADIVARYIPATPAAPVQGLRRQPFGGLTREQAIRAAQLGNMPGPQALPAPAAVPVGRLVSINSSRRYR